MKLLGVINGKMLTTFSSFLFLFFLPRPFRARLEELRMFLENETWELCPVKSNFNIAQLHVSKNHITWGGKGSNNSLIHIVTHLTPSPLWNLDNYMKNRIALSDSYVCMWIPVCQDKRSEVHCTVHNIDEDKMAAVPCGVYVGGFYFPHAWATVNK